MPPAAPLAPDPADADRLALRRAHDGAHGRWHAPPDDHGSGRYAPDDDGPQAADLARVLATAAHELKTPLASIAGFADLALAPECDEAQRRQAIEVIRRQSQVLHQLIDELLDLTRLESGDAEAPWRAVRLSSVARAACEGVAGLEGSVGLTGPSRVRYRRTPEAGQLWVAARRDDLRRALVNLLANALKYSSPQSPVTLTLDSAVLEGRRGARLRVVDRGIGMDDATRRRARERHYRADAVTPSHPGAGLGLAIVDEIVRRHDGRMEIASALGHGTSVAIWLPLIDEPQESSTQPMTLPAPLDEPAATEHSGLTGFARLDGLNRPS